MASQEDDVEWMDAGEWQRLTKADERQRRARPAEHRERMQAPVPRRATGNGSIPSRFKTVFYPRDDRKGFSSSTSRFIDSTYSANDCPGPGAYEATTQREMSTQDTTSLSKKGTGNFASKCRRFPRTRAQAVAPNSYNPDVSLRKLDQKDFRHTSTTRVFQDEVVPVAQRKERDTGPAPNEYNVPCSSKPLPAAASFKAKTKRETFQLHTAANPSPGQYDTNMDVIRPKPRIGHPNLFRSSVERTLFPLPEDTPGPGTYNSHIDVHIKRPAMLQNHYLCLSAPAIPLPPVPPLPGPTAYNLQKVSSFDKPQMRPDPSFKSRTGRWKGSGAQDTDPRIGPGSYNPKDQMNKQSFLLNMDSKWVGR